MLGSEMAVESKERNKEAFVWTMFVIEHADDGLIDGSQTNLCLFLLPRRRTKSTNFQRNSAPNPPCIGLLD
jgi:hypothetical protein